MEIKVGFEIAYAAAQPTPMVIMLSIHPSRFADIVGTERITAEPDVPIGFYRDSFGNVCGRLVAPSGACLHGARCAIRPARRGDATAQQLPIDQLPDEVLLYRCRAAIARPTSSPTSPVLFGNTPAGWARVQAITDFVHHHAPSATSTPSHEVRA
jgi:hypothetical protein